MNIATMLMTSNGIKGLDRYKLLMGDVPFTVPEVASKSGMSVRCAAAIFSRYATKNKVKRLGRLNVGQGRNLVWYQFGE
jgi:hypothetical protein